MEGAERMASLKGAARGEVGRGRQEKARACAEMPVSAAPAEPVWTRACGGADRRGGASRCLGRVVGPASASQCVFRLPVVKGKRRHA